MENSMGLTGPRTNSSAMRAEAVLVESPADDGCRRSGHEHRHADGQQPRDGRIDQPSARAEGFAFLFHELHVGAAQEEGDDHQRERHQGDHEQSERERPAATPPAPREPKSEDLTPQRKAKSEGLQGLLS
jgi:hypothetical protein